MPLPVPVDAHGIGVYLLELEGLLVLVLRGGSRHVSSQLQHTPEFEVGPQDR